MKTIILKKMMPFAVFALGILGAFATTSMQSTNEEIVPVIGYVSVPGEPCSIQVPCDTDFNEVCRLFYPSGPQAKALDDDSETTCSKEIYRP
jgi:hypothetical protein